MRPSHHTRRGRLAAVATVAALGAAASLNALTASSVVSASAVPLSSSVAASTAAPKQVATQTKPVTASTPQKLSARSVRTTARAVRPATKAPVRAQAMPAADASCAGLQSAVDTFMQHFYAAHLEASLGQQVADALSLDQYVKTHTVLIGNMLQPLLGGATSAVDTFMQHLYAAHLELSPGEQVADALALEQYVKTHTVMIADMLSPLAGADLSSC